MIHELEQHTIRPAEPILHGIFAASGQCTDVLDVIFLKQPSRLPVEAEEWYGSVLSFNCVDALMAWAVKNGPLTIENPEGTIHLALFESDNPDSTNVIAFGATGEEFLTWKAHLESLGLKLRVTDHKLAYSLYFKDPWRNSHEITTYEREYVAGKPAE